MANSDVAMSLDDAIEEVYSMLTGLELSYNPSEDRYHLMVRLINRALRRVARDQEWSYYSGVEQLGTTTEGMTVVELPSRLRIRKMTDDAIRLVDNRGNVHAWLYLLPRDALHKYRHEKLMRAAVTRTTVEFSRPIPAMFAGLTVEGPVMREPKMFKMPRSGAPVDQRVRNQLIDFDYPDLVTSGAALLYAMTDPVMQPRVPTLEEQYKNLMYQLIEIDTAFTDSPYINTFQLPMDGNAEGGHGRHTPHMHPHSDEIVF